MQASVGHQRLGLLADLVAGPLVVPASLAGARALRFALPLDEIGVCREIRERHPDEVTHIAESLRRHPLLETLAELCDDLETAQHRTCADLHRRRTEQHELNRVVRGLDSTDAADRHRTFAMEYPS